MFCFEPFKASSETLEETNFQKWYPFHRFLMKEMSHFASLCLLCSDLVCLWSHAGVYFHLPVRTSKARHVQAEQARRGQRVQTKTDHCVSHRPAAEESVSLVDQVCVGVIFSRDLEKLLHRGDQGAKWTLSWVGSVSTSSQRHQLLFHLNVGLLPLSSPRPPMWDWWQYYEYIVYFIYKKTLFLNWQL